jgi:hypothetical protein
MPCPSGSLRHDKALRSFVLKAVSPVFTSVVQNVGEKAAEELLVDSLQHVSNAAIGNTLGQWAHGDDIWRDTRTEEETYAEKAKVWNRKRKTKCLRLHSKGDVIETPRKAPRPCRSSSDVASQSIHGDAQEWGV